MNARRAHGLIIGLALWLAAPAAAWPRAGGGGGFGGGLGGGFAGPRPHGEATGAGMWIVVPVIAIGVFLVFIVPGLVGWYGRRRARRCEEAARDILSPALLKARVRECFFPVQESWKQGDVAPSRPYVSDTLYACHGTKLAAMKRRGRANRIEDLALNDVRIVRFFGTTPRRPSGFAARIEASARDWVSDVRRGVVVGGDPDDVTRFVEFWGFSRHPRYGWVLDEIRQQWRGPGRRRHGP